MDKINIQTLVPSATITNENKQLDINSIMNTTKQMTSDNFSSEQLVIINKKKREKLLDVFNRYYDRCIEKIKILNNNDKTDLIFNVPRVVPDCQNFNSFDCIDFIETKLKFHKFNTLKMNHNTLFITWKYLELNL